MRLYNLAVAVLLLSVASVSAATNYVVPTTSLTSLTANNTSAATAFVSQTNGNAGAGNVSKINIHSLLYSGEKTKVYAHLLLWFGASNHMNVGYNSTDPAQIHRQVVDMISRGIDGVIIDWYGPNNSIDTATKLVMKEAESHPGFTFAIMVDQGAIQWDSCTGCTPQEALINQLQYIEQTYFPSKAYMTVQGRPVITNFNIDLSYTIDWNAVNAALSTQPAFLFQNNDGFTHVLSGGSYSWVMPTTTDYGMSYLTSFYDTGIPLISEQTVGATYKGFNDSLASWGAGRVMGQQCGQTWLHTFSEINSLYNSGRQLSALQLVTWNDYEEGTEIETGISNCVTVSASVSGNALKWSLKGSGSTVDHYVAYISTDGKSLMALGSSNAGTSSLNLCSFPIPNGNYILFLQAVGKPSFTNALSGAVKFTAACTASGTTSLIFGASPSSMTVASGKSGNVTISATPQSGSFDSALALTCSGLPSDLTCSFSPAAITPGRNTASSILTISAASVASMSHKGTNPIYATWLFGAGALGLVFSGRMKRGHFVRALGACVLAAMTIAVTSCGGGAGSQIGASNGNASSHIVTVNGNSASVQFSTTITVTVQ